MMNLVEKAWIPVVTMEGGKTEASLRDIFHSGNGYADLAVRPHERVALMRLLICIAQAALDGPENLSQWDKVPEILPGKAESYLEKWLEYFDLFHPAKPFLQIAELKPFDSEKKKAPPTLCGLDFALATGDKSTLFDHQGSNEERKFSPGKLAVAFLTFQNFSLCGTGSNANWAGIKFTHTGNLDAPCAGGSMYHTFLCGRHLLETISLNLLTKRTVAIHYGNSGWGVPIWEKFPMHPNDHNAIVNATETYLGRLMPLTRYVKLFDDKRFVWCKGLPYGAYPDGWKCPEPSASVTLTNGQRVTLKASHSRGIWRKLAALVVKRKADEVGGALALENAPFDKDYFIHVGAMLRTPGKQVVEDFQESIFHVPAGMNTDIGRAAYEDEVAVAETKAWKLGRAVERWRKEMDPDWNQKLKAAGKEKKVLQERLRSIATNHFWTAVEKNLPLLLAYTASLAENDNDKRKKLWRKAIHRSAREAYKLACSRESPRQLRAFAIGLRELEREETQRPEEKEG
jgi:CRISPR system Cascade subunit CasA